MSTDLKDTEMEKFYVLVNEKLCRAVYLLAD